MYCNACGKKIPDDANLCAYCGRSVVTMRRKKRLMRPRVGRKIAGVCAGFCRNYFDLDRYACETCVASDCDLWAELGCWPTSLAGL